MGQSEPDYQAKIDETSIKIKKLKSQVEISRQQRQKLLKKVKQTDELIGNREQRIGQLNKDISEYEGQVDELAQQVGEIDQQVQLSKDMLGQMIRSSMQIKANNGLQVMLQHNDPAISNRLGVYYDYFFRAQKLAIEQTAAQLKTVSIAQQEAVKSRNWLLHLKKKASGQRNQYVANKAASRSKVKKIESSLSDTQKSVATLTAEQEKLSKLLEELRQNALGASGFFAAGKGKYPWPADGRLGARYGSTKSVGKLKWTGVLIESAQGNAVKTIADGEIVYADWLQGFGMLVIVDHGDSYMTLYGGNRELTVNQGDWVEHGATIATVGDTVGRKQSGVYFEIRHNAKPVNPEAWIDPENRFQSADIRAN